MGGDGGLGGYYMYSGTACGRGCVRCMDLGEVDSAEAGRPVEGLRLLVLGVLTIMDTARLEHRKNNTAEPATAETLELHVLLVQFVGSRTSNIFFLSPKNAPSRPLSTGREPEDLIVFPDLSRNWLRFNRACSSAWSRLYPPDYVAPRLGPQLGASSMSVTDVI